MIKWILSILGIVWIITWLSTYGVMDLDKGKALVDQYVTPAIEKTKEIAIPQEQAQEEYVEYYYVDNIDAEVNGLCQELGELSNRALRLREKLLRDVINSNSDNVQKVVVSEG